MQRIILDTNFLLIPIQFNVDIFSEIERICNFKYELCIIDKTTDELNKIIEEQKGKNKEAAKLALQLIKAKDIKIIKTKENLNIDNLILKLVKKGDIVATQDQELKGKLRKKGIGLISLRQKKYLITDYVR